MKILRTIAEVRAWRREQSRVHLVPTMGAFHEGHLSLMRAARTPGSSVIVSLFVNPLQFGPTEDLSKYPRQESEDFRMAEEVGVDAVFAPSPEELVFHMDTSITVGQVARNFEGAIRPGHFAGVATIVCKLFSITQADTAIFGLKDLQQCAVIKQMVRDLNLPIALAWSPTMREPNGLAMSSRNAYLTAEQRDHAAIIYHTLQATAGRMKSDPKQVSTLLAEARQSLAGSADEIQYFSLIDPQSFTEVSSASDTSYLIAAVKMFGVRLIDNVPIYADKSLDWLRDN